MASGLCWGLKDLDSSDVLRALEWSSGGFERDGRIWLALYLGFGAGAGAGEGLHCDFDFDFEGWINELDSI